MEEEDLVTTLCMLFNEMDVNGDDRIQWEARSFEHFLGSELIMYCVQEFTSYIVDSAMSDDVHTVQSEHLRQVPFAVLPFCFSVLLLGCVFFLLRHC